MSLGLKFYLPNKSFNIYTMTPSKYKSHQTKSPNSANVDIIRVRTTNILANYKLWILQVKECNKTVAMKIIK